MISKLAPQSRIGPRRSDGTIEGVVYQPYCNCSLRDTLCPLDEAETHVRLIFTLAKFLSRNAPILAVTDCFMDKLGTK